MRSSCKLLASAFSDGFQPPGSFGIHSKRRTCADAWNTLQAKSRSECRPGMRTCFFAAGWFQRRGAGAWRSHTAANPTFVAWSFCDTLRAVSNRPYFCPFFPDEHPKERSYLMTKKQKKTLKRIIISAVLYLAIILASKLVAIPWYLELVLFLVPYFIIGHRCAAQSCAGHCSRRSF